MRKWVVAAGVLVACLLAGTYVSMNPNGSVVVNASTSRALPPGMGDMPPQAKERAYTPVTRYAETLSARCSTPVVVCLVDEPKPVGSPCFCGDVAGTIIP